MKISKSQIIFFTKINTVTFILSFFIAFIADLIVKSSTMEIFFTTIKIFFSILPIVFLSQRNFLFKDGPLKAVLLILYYLLLMPIVNFSFKINKNNLELQYLFNILSFFNVILLIVSHIILLKYVVTDFLKRKRKIIPQDIGIVIVTYITIAISFGLLYTLISVFSNQPAFSGISQNLSYFQFYFKHIYFSFVTIATVGYGDVYPLTTIGEFLVMIEIITGIILTNVILGLLIGSGILTSNKDNK